MLSLILLAYQSANSSQTSNIRLAKKSSTGMKMHIEPLVKRRDISTA
jgi:hypothetical protein